MHQFTDYIRKELRRNADPEVATGMQKYLKTDQPFYGVKTPLRKKIYQSAKRSFPITQRKDYEAIIGELWEGPYGPMTT